MPKVQERVLTSGIVERRTYDENNKLVDIRKIYPKLKVSKKASRIPRSPGASGGHEF